MMQKLTNVESVAVPIMNANIDTDVITPMQRLTGEGDKPLSHYAFEPLRYMNGDGDSGIPDPGFPLNEERYAGAEIMICGENFGCGSSRESAPHAIAQLGFRCLIGSSFGDIFFNNCFQQGILPIVLPPDIVGRLAGEASAGAIFRVDLVSQRIATPGGEPIEFPVNALRKRSLLEGLDDIGLTLLRREEVARWQAADRRRRPWVWELPR